jgi:hypothetical protein
MTSVGEAPRLEFVFQIRLELETRLRYGPTLAGIDRGFVGLRGGDISGPRLQGKVLAGSGGDWPYIFKDSSAAFDAHYMLQADDGTLIEIRNRGYRHGPKEVLDKLTRYEPVDPGSYYMRVAPTFDVAAGPHEWLAQTIIIGVGDRHEGHSIFRYYAVM